MKKLTLFRLSFLLLALLLPNVTFAGSDNFEVDGIYYYTNGDSAYVETPPGPYGSDYFYDENYYSGDLTIPSTVNYYGETIPVVGISIYGPNLTSITIPNSVGRLYLSGCTGLTNISIPNSVTSLYLPGCTGLTSVTIPNSVTSIGSYAFYGCYGLTEITIGNSVTSIGIYALSGCTGLTSVTIPNSVTEIDVSAFEGCTGLTSVTIGSGVTKIWDYAFYGCDVLESVKCLGTVPPAMASIDCFSTAAYNNATLYVPSGCKDIYEATNYWYKFIHPIVVIVIYEVTGDVNGDGSTTIADVTALIDLLLGNGTAPAAADVTGDGQVTIADVTALIDMLLSGN